MTSVVAKHEGAGNNVAADISLKSVIKAEKNPFSSYFYA